MYLLATLTLSSTPSEPFSASLIGYTSPLFMVRLSIARGHGGMVCDDVRVCDHPADKHVKKNRQFALLRTSYQIDPDTSSLSCLEATECNDSSRCAKSRHGNSTCDRTSIVITSQASACRIHPRTHSLAYASGVDDNSTVYVPTLDARSRLFQRTPDTAANQ